MSYLLSIKRHWQITLLVVIMLPVLISLGFWQLARAEQKRELQAVYQQQRQLPAIALTELDQADASPYRSVIIEGRYLSDRYWLLDNRSRRGQTGYEVIMPVATDAGVVLVNRGWVAAAPLRSTLPEIVTPSGLVSIAGYLYPMTTNVVVQQSASDLAVDWPKRVLQLTPAVAAEALVTKVFPLWLRIDDNAPGALTTDWVITSVQPSKHQGYALQWFAMALALVIIYGVLLIKKDNERNS